MIYSSAPTSIPNMKAQAEILFEISFTQDFQILFPKGHNSEKGYNFYMKKIWVNYFFMRNVHMKFQNSSIHRSKVNRRTHAQTDKPKAICPSNKVGGIKITCMNFFFKTMKCMKTKMQISCAVNANLISTFNFATHMVQSFYFFNRKFKLLDFL